MISEIYCIQSALCIRCSVVCHFEIIQLILIVFYVYEYNLRFL